MLCMMLVVERTKVYGRHIEFRESKTSMNFRNFI